MSETRRRIGLKAALMLTGTDMMVGSMFVIPVMGYISASFGGVDPSMVMTIVALMAIPGILIVGKLSEYVSKKTILVVGTTIFAIAGGAGGFCTTLTGVIITRAIMGLGAGVLVSLPSALIAQLFDGPERVQLLGWSQAMGSIFAVIASTLGGIIGVINWRFCFFVVFVYLGLAVFQAFAIPHVPPERSDAAIIEDDPEGKKRMGWQVVVFFLAVLFIMAVTGFYQTRVSIFVLEEGIGTSVQAGLVTSIMTIVGFVLNLLFGKLFAWFKRGVAFISPLLFGSAFFCLASAQSPLMLYVGGFLMGGSAISFAYYVARVSMSVPKRYSTMAISLVAIAQFAGQFMATPIIHLYAACGITAIRTQFAVTGVACLVFAALAFIFVMMTRKTEGQTVASALAASASAPSPAAAKA